MTKALAAHVKKVAKSADTKALADALGDLVLKRLHTKAIANINAKLGGLSIPKGMTSEEAQRKLGVGTPEPKAKVTRRSTRRRGRNQAYVPTSKPDISRLGTFRHYMLQTIRRHKCTWDAEAEHANCDNPKFAKNRLDFSWAASEGYIDFV